VAAALSAVSSFEAWGRKCSTVPGRNPNMACLIDVHDCGTVPDAVAATPPVNVAATVPDCITVRLTYDYGTEPIIPNVPLVGVFMPDTVETTATAQLTFPGP